MEEAIQAFDLAIEYTNHQIEWYDRFAFVKLFLFRTFGVITIMSAILITYLSATLDEKNPEIK